MLMTHFLVCQWFLILWDPITARGQRLKPRFQCTISLIVIIIKPSPETALALQLKWLSVSMNCPHVDPTSDGDEMVQLTHA